MLVEVGGAPATLSVGDRCEIVARGNRPPVTCEVVGFRGGRALMMPFGPLEGIGLGCRAVIGAAQPVIHPHPSWLGRVVNAVGQPIDGKGALPQGLAAYPLRASPPPAHARKRVSGKIDLGAGSAWEFSPPPASANPCCCRCWPSSRRPMSTSSG
jgi:flagellum-specific ATP synthase